MVRARTPPQQGGHRARAVASLGIGALTAVVSGVLLHSWPFAAVGGWAMASSTFLLIIWTHVAGCSSEATALSATAEDDTRGEAGALLIGSSLVSLVGVVFGLVRASKLSGWREVVLTALSVLVVVLSWTVVHTVFMLRYAHEFYSDRSEAAIDFGDKGDPDYLDFAYLAFTIGMTFQVSDTRIANRTIRRTVLRQALLSYVFGTVIVAVTINVVAGLVSS